MNSVFTHKQVRCLEHEIVLQRSSPLLTLGGKGDCFPVCGCRQVCRGLSESRIKEAGFNVKII